MSLVKYLVLAFCLGCNFSAKSEELSDVVNDHSYTLYNGAAAIAREFYIDTPSGLNNLLVISATKLVADDFVSCRMNVYRPDGSLVANVSCQDTNTQVFSPSVLAISGLRIEVGLQYFDSSKPTGSEITYSFKSRFRFSDTANNGDPTDPTDPTDPEEPVDPEDPVEPPTEIPAIVTASDYKSSMAPARGYATHSMVFTKNQDYPVLIGFNRIISMLNISSCSVQVIGYKKVDGKTVGSLYHNGNCAASNTILFKTPLNPTDYDSISVLVRFQNTKTFSTLVSSSIQLLLGSDEDADADGMPAWYEEHYGFSEQEANDALIDTDNDGYSNLEEYLAGSDPTNVNSIPLI